MIETHRSKNVVIFIQTNPEKVFYFLEHFSWIGYVKLSLLRREYLSSAVNVLSSGRKILDITNRDFFNSISLTGINKYDKVAVVQLLTVFGTIYHVACQRIFWNESF